MEIQETPKKLTEQEVAQSKVDKVMNAIAFRTAYYRANPHIFCKEYLGLNLKLFQKILIVMMNFCNYFMFLASRGLGKTFLTAIFCCVRCILYPGTRICVASGRRRQAMEVLEKILTQLMPNSVNLKSEIKAYSLSQADAYIEFHNGSRIKVVTASDTARGARANILVCDEFRLVSLDVIQSVLRKFLIAPRQPGYLNKPEFSHLTERNKEIYMSSCWYQSHWAYDRAKTYTKNLVDSTRKYFICGLPYQLAIKENLLSKEQVEDEMSEADFNAVTWMMEMECLFFSDTNGGLYSYEDIEKTRKIKYPIYPASHVCKLPDKRLHIPPRQPGEIRILSADIALMASNKQNNDATAIFFNQCIPSASGNKYVSNITYTINYEGLRTDDQALIIRKLVDELDCDYLAIDCKGLGLPVTDLLMADIYDPNTGITYPALSCCNNKEIADRCHVPDAPKKIWAVMGSPEFNTQCALGLRESFRQGTARLLISDYDCEDALQELAGYNKLSTEDKISLKMPYINTTLLTNELVELEYEAKNNAIKVIEKKTKRKDRYSSLSYNIYVAKQVEREAKARASRQKSGTALAFKFKAPQIRKNH